MESCSTPLGLLSDSVEVDGVRRAGPARRRRRRRSREEVRGSIAGIRPGKVFLWLVGRTREGKTRQICRSEARCVGDSLKIQKDSSSVALWDIKASFRCCHFVSVRLHEGIMFSLFPFCTPRIFPLEEIQNYSLKLTLRYKLAQRTPIWTQLAQMGTISCLWTCQCSMSANKPVEKVTWSERIVCLTNCWLTEPLLPSCLSFWMIQTTLL